MAARWYIVHAYSNFEKKVAESIEEKARQKGLEHLFEKILVPTEKVVEVRRGRKVDSERKFFPGYVLVRANLTDEAYHLIKNTPKVTGFLGSDNKPVPIPDYEAERILGQVQEGVELVNRAGEALGQITTSIQKVTALINDIANASAEQSSGVDEINKAMTLMDTATQQNSALVEENAATAKTLEHQAKAMDERVAFFKVGGAVENRRAA